MGLAKFAKAEIVTSGTRVFKLDENQYQIFKGHKLQSLLSLM